MFYFIECLNIENSSNYYEDDQNRKAGCRNNFPYRKIDIYNGCLVGWCIFYLEINISPSINAMPTILGLDF
jgi:hypothetical protein